uniref:Uncharacterized protein n=1 Tax=Trypanosoma congolense (strain IL3000) TaxID=1068625 RepID=G0UYG2_TRYCI|nr:conserved hypothetical protein [Trypanosoma congolense IL3000]
MEPLREVVSLDESVDRFNLICKQLMEYGDAWYDMRVAENHLLFGSDCSEIAGTKVKKNKKRYFSCFYDSFKGKGNEYFGPLAKEIFLQECEERRRISQYEFEERQAVYHSLPVDIRPSTLSYIYFSAMHPIDGEAGDRVVIESEYYDMLMEVTFALECLHRRSIMFLDEAVGRKEIEDKETKSWIQSHKRQTERENNEKVFQMSQEQVLAYHSWKQWQREQIILLKETELNERLDIERLQRFHVNGIAGRYLVDLREARYHQKKYEMRQRLLPAEVARDLVLEETSHRTAIMLQQRDDYLHFVAECAKDFYATRRNVLRNSHIAEERRCAM